MPYIEPAEIERVRRIDLLGYLEQGEPGELIKTGAGTYKTKTHDSLKISNGKWHWWSKNIGGVSAIDYLVARGIDPQVIEYCITPMSVRSRPRAASTRSTTSMWDKPLRTHRIVHLRSSAGS